MQLSTDFTLEEYLFIKRVMNNYHQFANEADRKLALSIAMKLSSQPNFNIITYD